MKCTPAPSTQLPLFGFNILNYKDLVLCKCIN